MRKSKRLSRKLNEMLWVDKLIREIYIRSINKCSSVNVFPTIGFMDMTKNMNLRFDLLDSLEERFAASMLSLVSTVKNSHRRAMSNNNIYSFRNRTPQLSTIFAWIHKAPIKEIRTEGRAKDFYSLNFHHFMLKVGTNFLQLFYLFLRVERAVLMLRVFQLFFIRLPIKGKVMISCDNNLVFVG